MSASASAGGRALFRITSEPIDPARAIASVSGTDCGAVSVFLGTARDRTGGRRVLALEYEAYASMAESVMEEIGTEVALRHSPCRIAVEHRTGRLLPGEIAVVVVAASPHRAAAFAACREVIERVKARAPIWKKEFFEDGAEWVSESCAEGAEAP